MKQPVFLRIFRGDQLEGVKQFTESQVVIGRNPGLQVTLGDEQVSPLHAVIEERDSGYYLSDLGSASGTLRGGKKILDEKIESGDEITIGSYRIQFFVGIPKPVTPPAGAVTQKVSSPAAQVLATPATPKLKMPTVGAASAPKAKHKKSGSTFAPPSYYTDVAEIMQPSKGTVVEIVVAWKERVISTHHFSHKHMVTAGADPACDIQMPLVPGQTKANIVRVDSLVSVLLTTDMSGELYKDGSKILFADLHRQHRMRSGANGLELDLQQGEMIRVGFQGDLISVYVRFVPETPKPLMAPLLDLTASEATGVILATLVTIIFALYMLIYSPSSLEDETLQEEPIRKAIVTFNPPPKKVVVEPTEEPPKEKKIVEVKDEKKKEERKAVQVTTAPKENPKKATPLPGKEGKAGEVAPKDTTDKTKKLTSAKPGGAIKTAPKEGANVKSEKPDPTKVGLLSVFGTKGTQSKLDKSYSGAGELQGMADTATGYAGQAEDREGDNIGTKLKDTGAGGKGTQTVGIAGVGTKGKGGGDSGYGTGGGIGGLGKKGSVDINVEGSGADFVGSIDREAIRRVILANKAAIRSCYERVLQRKPDMYGKLVLEWDIEEKGRVTRASVVSNSLGDDEVASCIISRLKTWRFPEPPQDQVGRVTYPFVFTSQ